MRKLAHIERVTNIRPIEGADRIEQVNVLGWNVVIKKGEFKEGDKCVYIEIDSICPDKPHFEFLRDRNFKVKTIKLKGVVSQGLILPLSILPKGDYVVGDDVTEVLGITKHDDSEINTFPNRPVKKYKWFKRLWYKFFHKKKKKSSFPSWVKKTDETRIQNMPHILNHGGKFVVTEKVDGCSATFTLRKKLFGFEYLVCSRNRVADKNSAYTEISEKYRIEEVLKSIYKQLGGKYKYLTIQGEIVGPRIQGNKYNLEEYDLYVFNFLVGGKLLPTPQTHHLMRIFGIKHVPILGLIELPNTVDEMVKLADGTSQLYNTPREGLVLRYNSPKDDVSFKVISIEFLLKHKI